MKSTTDDGLVERRLALLSVPPVPPSSQIMVQGSVCIIGGGASGIIALEEMLDLGLNAVLFEARAEVGGAWLLSDDAGPCEVVFDGDEATLKSPTERTGQADGIREGPPPPTPVR